MRIEDVGAETRDGRRRIQARLIWEDCPLPPSTLWIETVEPFASSLEPTPEAFLLASLPLAVLRAERRVAIEGPVCCRLRDGLTAAMDLFRVWYRVKPLRIESARGFIPTIRRETAGSASFFSGGVDAIALLRSNRLDYPLGHSGSIRDCLFVFGLNTYDFAEGAPVPERLAAFESYVRRVTPLSRTASFTLIPVYTNVRTLYPDYVAYRDVGSGAGLAATALSLPSRLASVRIGSTGLGMGHRPWGSHPALDHLFSSEAVAVEHAQPGMSRFDKIRLIGEWHDALPHLKTCKWMTIPPEGQLNCGRCEKCVRTMLELLAVGALERATSFPHRDLTPAMLEGHDLDDGDLPDYYRQCVESLERVGRSDLARVIRKRLDTLDRTRRWKQRAALWRRVLTGGRRGPEPGVHAGSEEWRST